MADNWYYVQKGNRHGPVAIEVIESMLGRQELRQDDFVWKKGFENWKKVREVSEFQTASDNVPPSLNIPQAPKKVEQEPGLYDLGDERAIFVRIGSDRGGASNDYGPFDVNQIKQLFKENRINGKTFIFYKGLKTWKILADFPEYQELFEEMPPVIKEADKRAAQRKPFVARMFVQNNKKLYEGICRDISVGGMQVLMDDFKGSAGDKISINVHPENTDYHFTAAGVVVRLLEGNAGFSFRFNALSDEAKRSIEKYLQEN